MRHGSLDDLVVRYHLHSRNLSIYKHLHTAHQVHYDPKIIELCENSPLHLSVPERVALPDVGRADRPLDRVIMNRRSGRGFDGSPLAASDLATLLVLSNGVRRREETPRTLPSRNVPSSGNLGSIEIFPVVLNVHDIDAGLYHFDTVHHDLALLKRGRFANWLRRCILYQIEFSRASAALVLTAAIGRLASKYGPRAYRLAHLDAGHVSAQCYLVASALDLEVCATAGFIDEELDVALGLDGIEVATMLVLLVGPKHGRGDR